MKEGERWQIQLTVHLSIYLKRFTQTTAISFIKLYKEENVISFMEEKGDGKVDYIVDNWSEYMVKMDKKEPYNKELKPEKEMELSETDKSTQKEHI